MQLSIRKWTCYGNNQQLLIITFFNIKMSLKLTDVTEEEWDRFAKQTAKRIINNGLGDGRKRHIGDYSHKRLLLKFGQILPFKKHNLRLEWFDRVDAEIKRMKK